jgi:hypothetical protein
MPQQIFRPARHFLWRSARAEIEQKLISAITPAILGLTGRNRFLPWRETRYSNQNTRLSTMITKVQRLIGADTPTGGSDPGMGAVHASLVLPGA